MSFVIGVDGGATRTRGVAVDLQGRVLAFVEDDASNFHHVGSEAAGGTISRIAAELARKMDETTPAQTLALGLAGVGRPASHETMHAELTKRFSESEVLLVTDADAALIGGCLSDSGIIVIAGTGSIVYGRSRDGSCDRVGGHGALLSDEGSGYRLAVEGLRAMMRSHDGLEPETAITEKVLKKLGKSGVEEVVDWSLQDSTGKEEIARLGEAVLSAFEASDPAADGVVVDQADCLATSVSLLHRRLELEPATPVVLAGGAFTKCDAYAGLVTRKIRYFLPAAKVTSPKLVPVLGAAILALNHAAVEMDQEILARLSDTYAQIEILE